MQTEKEWGLRQGGEGGSDNNNKTEISRFPSGSTGNGIVDQKYNKTTSNMTMGQIFFFSIPDLNDEQSKKEVGAILIVSHRLSSIDPKTVESRRVTGASQRERERWENRCWVGSTAVRLFLLLLPPNCGRKNSRKTGDTLAQAEKDNISCRLLCFVPGRP
jgi:hypothetical protein